MPVRFPITPLSISPSPELNSMPVFSMAKRKITVRNVQKLMEVAHIGPVNTMKQMWTILIPALIFTHRRDPFTSTFKTHRIPDGRNWQTVL